MLFIFDISVVMLSQQDLPVYRCSNKPKLEESTEHLRQVQWASTCGHRTLTVPSVVQEDTPVCFEASCGVSFLGTPVLRAGRLKEVPKNAPWKQSWERGVVGKGPKKLPKERPVCLFPFDLLQRDCTLLHPAPTIRQHPCGVWKTDSEIPCRTPYSVTDLGLELVGRMVTHDGCVKFGSQIESMVQTCCNW